MKLTHEQMLELWMMRRYGETPRCDAAVTRTDGIDLATLATAEMRAWYLALLDEGPRELLVPEEIASKVLVEQMSDGSALVSLPPTVRRLLTLRLRGSLIPCAIVSDPASVIARRQHNPMTRGAACHPVAIVVGPKLLRVWPTDSRDVSVSSATAAVDTGENTYQFDERALATIPTAITD